MKWGVRKYLKYLILSSDDNEIFYDMDTIANIVFGLAQSLLDESEIHSNGFKTLEILMVIYFNNNSTATFRTANLEMYFE